MALPKLPSEPTKVLPTYWKTLRIFFAAGMGLAPLTLTLYNLFNPLIRGNGKAMIAAYQAANPTTNQIHLVFGVATGLLLPVGFVGLAILAAKHSPWYATLGGMFGLVGWIPWCALISLEALVYDMVQMGGGDQFATLWDQFNGDGVMTFYLLFYIICHLLSAVFLGIALGRSRVVRAWSAWALILSSPLTIIAFPVHSPVALYLVCVFFIIGMIPSALVMLQSPWPLGPQ